jgi:hypothetical protein
MKGNGYNSRRRLADVLFPDSYRIELIERSA